MTKLEEQIRESRQIIQKSPKIHDYYNHAMLCAEFGDWDEATEVLTLANKELPECPVIARYLSIGLLKQGKLKEGLGLFERRFEHPIYEGPPVPFGYTVGPRIRERYEKPYWDGKKSLSGKTVYVFNEGGHGDIIQNIRYLPQLRAMCNKVILEARTEVSKVLAACRGLDEVIECGTTSQMLFFKPKQNLDKVAQSDYVLSLHSLMYYFDPELNNIPCVFPYIFPQPTQASAVETVKNHPAKLKIGIVWAGKPGHGNDNRRSTMMKSFLPLKSIPGAKLFSLQKGEMNRSWNDVEINLLDGGEVLESIDLGPHLNDFNDTAAVLKELNALVCVDTSAAHLAGALNTPVWSILPTKCWAEWRWQKKWYDSQKVVFQKTDGDWTGLLEEVAKDITNILT